MIEMLFVIAILGILSALGFSKFSGTNSALCVKKISQNLDVFQGKISQLFTQKYLKKRAVTAADVQNAFEKSKISEKNCEFLLDPENFKILARAGEKSTEFLISPQDFSQNLKISCAFVQRHSKKPQNLAAAAFCEQIKSRKI